MKKNLCLMGLFLMAISLLTVSCGKKEAGEVKKKATIAWYAPAPHPYFEEVKSGVEAFEKETGVEVIKQVGADWMQQSETQNVEALAAKGVEYFSIYPSDPSGANGLYEELSERGVSIVNFGAPTLEPTTAKFLVGTHIKQSAMDATEYLLKQMNYKGNIVNVLEVLEDANTVTRKQAVEEVVAKYPDVKIIQEVSGMATIDEAVQKVQDVIAANINEIDGIIATGFTPAVGIATALTDYYESGGEKEIKSILIDTDPVVMKALGEGYVTATVAQNPYGHGYISMHILNNLSNGKEPKAGVYYVDAGTLIVEKSNMNNFKPEIEALTKEIKDSLNTKYFK